MNPISTRILLLLLFFVSLVTAANFTRCLEDFKANPAATGGVDSHGRDVSSADAVGLNYATCTERCGTTAESFDWIQFAQALALWLVPWLMLVTQLPFGSGNYIDDFVSAIMSVGSPALAAYSLMITAFNTRIVYRRANYILHEEKVDMARALVALQHAALDLTTDQHLLELILIDSKWKRKILKRLERHAWSLATGFSVAWVLIAFVFTLTDSFVSLNDTNDSRSEGLAFGTLWLWLPCLVIGWLWIPTFSFDKLNTGLRRANDEAVKAAANIRRETAKKIKERANEVIDRAKVVNTRFQKPTHNPKASNKSDTGVADEVVDEDKKAERESIHGGEPHAVEMAEPGSTSPLSPSSSTTSGESSAESQRDLDHPSTDGIQTAQRSATSVVRSTETTQPAAAISVASFKYGHDMLFIPLDNTSLLHSDELRHPATFNYARVMRHRVLVDGVLRALDKLILADKKKTRFPQLAASPDPERTTFPRGVLYAMFASAIFALLLQIGITGAAVVIIVFTPTVGLGCRSLGYTVYGVLSIIIMFLTIISTILARISETRKGKSPYVKDVTAFVAIAIRWTCYLFALLNSVGLIVLACLQFSNFLASCYCNSSVIGRGTNTYIVVFLQDWIPTMRKARIVGIAAAAGSISIFMISLGLVSTPPKDLWSI